MTQHRNYLRCLVFFASALLSVVFCSGTAATAQELPTAATTEYIEKINKISRLLDYWKVDKAFQELASLRGKERPLDEGGISLQAQILKGRGLYLKGQYNEALKALEVANRFEQDQHSSQSQGENRGSLATRDEGFAELLGRVQRTATIVDGYEKFTTPHGWFTISVRRGKDQLLVPIASDLLEKAYKKLTRRLGAVPPTPIRVEIYPSHNVLAEVSSLTLDEIRTSGTIALCKYNRVMVTTPSAQPYGYDWADTLVHEFVHYLIHTRTEKTVPIWLHEGMAKYLERSWRDNDPLADNAGMQPFSSTLLRRRIREGKLISFEQMHPSMAKLPSQEDAATAFAEVHSLIAYVVEKGEAEERTPLRKTLDLINSSVEPKRALAMSLGTTFPQLETSWRNYIKNHPFRTLPEDATYDERLTFKESAKLANGVLSSSSGEKNTNYKSSRDHIKNPKAKDYAAIAMLLQGRGFRDAALVEYRKSIAITGPIHPFTVSRMATALNDSQKESDAAEAEKNLRALLAFYPSFAPAYLQLGRALSTLGKRNEAIDTLENALLYNPFDPGIYTLLLSLYPKDEYQKRIRAEKAMAFL